MSNTGASQRDEIDFQTSASQLYEYVKKTGYEGYDPYDGLNGQITSSLGKRNKWLNIFIIQAFKTSPINPRAFFKVHKSINLKSIGLFASAYLKLYRVTKEKKFLTDAEYCLNLLKNTSLKERYSEYCWVASSYNVQFPDDLGTPDVPSIVCTATCTLAFLHHYETTGSEDSLQIAKSAARFIVNHLYLSDKEKSMFRYTPTYKTNISIYNASTFGVRILSHIYRHTKNTELLDISNQVMEYILSKQKTNGAWYFSEMNGVERKQIDFHQGFLLDALDDFIKNMQPEERKYSDALRKGAEFYRNEQFLPDGRCKWRYPRLWPVDIHNQAQGILTFSRLQTLKPEYLEFARTIADWTITHMQDKSGYFYYQKWPVLTNKISYIRWGQAWMLLALSNLLEASSLDTHG
jgi:uncharacterized protein YyaL (SSP411 family)